MRQMSLSPVKYVICYYNLMYELAVFVDALLYVILKAHAIFISVTVLLATLSVAQAKKKQFTVKSVDIQVAL